MESKLHISMAFNTNPAHSVHPTECYLAIKIMEVLTQTAARMDLEHTVLSYNHVWEHFYAVSRTGSL